METKTIRRRVIITITSLSFALILLAATAICKTYYQRSKAQQLVLIASRLDLGKANKQEFRRLAGSLNGYELGDPEPNGRSESVTFGFENSAAMLLNIIPSKTVYVRLDFLDDVLIRKQLRYAESSGIAGSVTEEIKQEANHDSLAFLRNNGRVLSVNRGAPPYRNDIPVQIVGIVDDISVTSERRESDWKIDLGCMTSLRRCADLRAVFVGALKDVS